MMGIHSKGGEVLYFDTDSIMYVSQSGGHLVDIDTNSKIGLWTSEIPPDDYINYRLHQCWSKDLCC